jgi:hypothetical protein
LQVSSRDDKKEKEEPKLDKSREQLLKELDPDSEEYMMLKMGFPVGFDTTQVITFTITFY